MDLGITPSNLTEEDTRKLSDFETFIAIIKGYCGTLILNLPGTFAMGGYLASPFLLLLSAVITTFCVVSLVKVGLHYKSYSYSDVMQ